LNYTGLDAVLERLLAVAENLFNVLRFIGNVQTVRHHLLQCLWVMKVENFTRSVVALANVVKKKFNHSAEKLRCLYLARCA